MSRPRIDSFLWDDENEAKVAGHGLSPDDVDDLLVAAPFAVFRNRGRYSAASRQLIGRNFGGQLVTVIIEPVPGVPGLWRPRTAWPAKKSEAAKARKVGVT